jgi:hypothetical protein
MFSLDEATLWFTMDVIGLVTLCIYPPTDPGALIPEPANFSASELTQEPEIHACSLSSRSINWQLQ